MSRGRFVVSMCALAVLVWACTAAAGIPNRPLRTAIYFDPDGARWDPSSESVALTRTRRAGATAARITVYWWQIAPPIRPRAWDPSNPGDPNYRWGSLDSRIRNIVRHGLEPLVTILAAPRWAQGTKPTPPNNSYLPDPVAFGQFAKAAAIRYSGTFAGLPRVRWWQAWNEPNISLYLVPQLENGQPISPGWYRRMLNEFATAVHSVHPDNLVVAAGLAPFRDITPSVQAQDPDWGPLSFMRALLCLSKSLRATCNDRVSFDVWATHPYTSGGPLHHAVLPNDVSLGDLPEMRRTLDAAVKAHHVQSRRPIQFWVTEFSWDSNPPDRCSPPLTLLERWIPEALYRMWANGVSLVVWLQLQDLPLSTSFYQAGFYFDSVNLATAKPKPTLKGFRFPFVALRRGQRVAVWARTPFGRPARLIIEQKPNASRAWKKVAVVTTNRSGILQVLVRAKPIGLFRARMFPTNEASLPFSMKVPRDHFYNPFGQTVLLEPTNQPQCRSAPG